MYNTDKTPNRPTIATMHLSDSSSHEKFNAQMRFSIISLILVQQMIST